VSVQLVSKISDLCDPDPPTSQTDRRRDRQTHRQTDRQTTCDRNTALCTKVHRAIKRRQTFSPNINRSLTGVLGSKASDMLALWCDHYNRSHQNTKIPPEHYTLMQYRKLPCHVSSALGLYLAERWTRQRTDIYGRQQLLWKKQVTTQISLILTLCAWWTSIACQ